MPSGGATNRNRVCVTLSLLLFSTPDGCGLGLVRSLSSAGKVLGVDSSSEVNVPGINWSGSSPAAISSSCSEGLRCLVSRGMF
jgi:hypothetical protein